MSVCKETVNSFISARRERLMFESWSIYKTAPWLELTKIASERACKKVSNERLPKRRSGTFIWSIPEDELIQARRRGVILSSASVRVCVLLRMHYLMPNMSYTREQTFCIHTRKNRLARCRHIVQSSATDLRNANPDSNHGLWSTENRKLARRLGLILLWGTFALI